MANSISMWCNDDMLTRSAADKKRADTGKSHDSDDSDRPKKKVSAKEEGGEDEEARRSNDPDMRDERLAIWVQVTYEQRRENVKIGFERCSAMIYLPVPSPSMPSAFPCYGRTYAGSAVHCPPAR